MIPLLTTCCCGIVSVRTAALLVAALFIFGCGVHLFVNIFDSSGAVNSIYGHRGFIVVMIINIVSIVVNILLIVGIAKGKAKLVFPAVIYYFLIVCLYCVVLIAFFILDVNNRWAKVSGVEILVFSLELFFPAKILVYFWLVVYSCYRQMKWQEP